MKKTVEIIVSWEQGTEAPTYVQLETLAYTVYKRPLAVFFFPQPPNIDSPRRAFRTLPDAIYSSFPAHATHLFRFAQAMQLNLYELCNGKNPYPKNITNEIIPQENMEVDELVFHPFP